jgi:hypothetical protein
MAKKKTPSLARLGFFKVSSKTCHFTSITKKKKKHDKDENTLLC